jgi:hypothetical protein
MATLSIEEKLAAQPSFGDWVRAELSDADRREFYFGGGSRLGEELYNLEKEGKLKISLVENANGTVTEEHEWDADAKNDFLKDQALANALAVFERYQEYLRNL